MHFRSVDPSKCSNTQTNEYTKNQAIYVFISFIYIIEVIYEILKFRMLVYEYVNNGNLEQWLHGAMRQHGYLTWEARMKVLLGTAKA